MYKIVEKFKENKAVFVLLVTLAVYFPFTLIAIVAVLYFEEYCSRDAVMEEYYERDAAWVAGGGEDKKKDTV